MDSGEVLVEGSECEVEGGDVLVGVLECEVEGGDVLVGARPSRWFWWPGR